MKIAYIDHSYHKKTKSTLFFIDLLKKNNHVDEYWCDYWKNKKTLDLSKIAKKKYDAFIFLQVFYPLKELEKIKDQNIIFIPMYDGVQLYFDTFWLKYKKYKFICFSNKLYGKLKNLGLDCIHVQYYLKNKQSIKKIQSNLIKNKREIKVFFWLRRNEITWKMIKKLLSKTPISQCFIHVSNDPNSNIKLPSKDDIIKYNIKFSSWYKTRKEYLNTIKKVDIFIAPRLFEGIGLSFIEAMSLGKCIIAPDRPTMNEYIKNEYNGFLFNPFFVKSINPENINQILKNVLNNNNKGYIQWIKNKDKINKFIFKKTNQSKINLIKYSFIFLRGAFNIIKAYYNKYGFLSLYFILKTILNKILKKITIFKS